MREPVKSIQTPAGVWREAALTGWMNSTHPTHARALHGERDEAAVAPDRAVPGPHPGRREQVNQPRSVQHRLQITDVSTESY